MIPKYDSTNSSGRFNVDEAIQRTRIANELAEVNFNLVKQNDFLSLILYTLSAKLDDHEKMATRLTLKKVQDRK